MPDYRRAHAPGGSYFFNVSTSVNELARTRALRSLRSLVTLEEVERAHIVKVLEATGWRLSGTGGAAELLGLKYTTLQSRMQKLGITRKP